MKHAIIVDLDGTLALMGDRDPFDYARCGEDVLNEPVHLVVQAYHQQYQRDIIIVSGREDTCRKQTLRWLQRWGIPHTALYMRKARDYRKDTIVKREIYRARIEPEYAIDFVLDDRNQVVEMWRELGLTCFQVAYGDF